MLSSWFPDLFPIRDPVLIFAIVLVLFLASPIVMGRVKLPGMIGLLLAGAILGPQALGVLARDASFILLGAVGLIYIMFTAALEIDLTVFRKYGVQGVVFGVLTFSIPQGVGTLMAHYVLGFEWLSAVLLASMFASHTLLAYPIVSRQGLASNQAVTTALGGTMITDTAALLVLAVIAGMASGEVDEAFWWRLGVSLTVFVSAILLGLPRLGRWFFRRMAGDGAAEFVFVLTSVFLCAALSHAAGLEPIVGAFLAGLALNRLIPHSSPLMNRLTFTGDALFIPFFLLSVGMLLDARVLFGGFRTWFVAIGMTVTVIGTKWLAAQAARFVFRFRKEEGTVMFGLSVVQAAATLAAVMVGHRLELFDDSVVNGTIVMILVTCVLGPAVVAKAAPILAALLKGEDAGPREQRGVLMPLQTAEQAGPAVELALLLRGHEKAFPIFPIFVAGEGDELDRAMAEGDKILGTAVSQASAADCVAQPIKRVHDRPGRALGLARKEVGARHIVVPWDALPSKTGGSEGRVIDELVNDPHGNLFLARLPHALGTHTRVVLLVPPGLADRFGQAAALIMQLGKALGAPMLVLCHEPDRAGLEEAFPASSGQRISYAVYPTIRMWLSLVNDQVVDSDLLMVLGVRDRTAPAAREFRGVAQRLAARHPENGLIVFYPESALPEAEGAAVAPTPAAEALLEETVVENIPSVVPPG